MMVIMEKGEKEEFLSEIRQLFDAQSRHIVGVVTEHYDDKIKLVVEQYTGLREEFDGVKRILGSHTEMIGELAVDVVGIRLGLKGKADTADVSVLKRRLDILEANQ